MARSKVVSNPKVKFIVELDSQPMVAGVKVAKKSLDQLKGKTKKTAAATKKATVETRNFKQAWDGVKKLGAGSGTWLGGMTADIGDLGEGLAEVGGKTGLVLGAGAAVTAVAVAAAGAAYASIQLFKSWRDLTLEALELAEAMDGIEGQRMAAVLMEAKIASDEFTKSLEILKVMAATEMAPAFAALTRHLTDIAAGMIVTPATLDGWRSLMEIQNEAITNGEMVLGLRELLARAGEKKAASIRAELKAQRELIEEQKRLKKAKEEAAEAAETERKELERLKKIMDEIMAIKFKPFAGIVEDEIKFRDATKQIVNHTQDGIKDMDALIEDYDKSLEDSKWADVRAAEVAQKEKTKIAFQGAQAAVDLADMASRAYIQGLDMETEAGRKAAREAFAIQKVTAIAAIQISVAQGIVKAFAEYGWPWGAIPAGLIGTLGMAQSAIVAAEQPTFPMGGVIPSDHSLISAMPGEAILNRRATEELGSDGIHRLNTGRGGGGSMVVVQQYRHRVFDAFVADNLTQDGPLSRRFDKLATVGHTRRR